MVTAGDLRLEAELGRPHPLFALRPRRLRRSLAWVLDGYRRITAARGTLAGDDLGGLAELRADVGFGFSGFPARPALVTCSPVLEGPWRRDG